ncbi:MAG: hypothetical protein JJ975_16490 [Bacteroidia bacterium]|nr:hypothetical protein [Bacteroidia bacterium]
MLYGFLVLPMLLEVTSSGYEEWPMLTSLLLFLGYCNVYTCLLWLPLNRLRVVRLITPLHVITLILLVAPLVYFALQFWLILVIVFFASYLLIQHSLKRQVSWYSKLTIFGLLVCLVDLAVYWIARS